MMINNHKQSYKITRIFEVLKGRGKEKVTFKWLSPENSCCQV